jgi:hypothetical protein
MAPLDTRSATMKTIAPVLATIFLFAFNDGSLAASACMEHCKDKNRIEVGLCNYPQTDLATQKKCLQTARDNFDSCKTACGAKAKRKK